MFEREQRSRTYYEARARWYDWTNRLAAFLRGASPTRERRKAVRRLQLKPGDRVLEVCVGTGTNVALLAQRVGDSGQVVGLDISRAMLTYARRKIEERRIRVDLIEGEAGHLPFPDATFDAVLHHGGIAEFGDRRGAIEEMYRVVRPAGRVVICDVGVPESGRLSLVNRFLLRFQPEYNNPPPMDLVPASAQDVKLGWFFHGAWYMIEFAKPA
ncbi:MAG: class I SAM-dependent methyltransferase [Dehalococcoidia bacterium]